MIDVDVDLLEITDPELISMVRDGDVTAYGTLFRRHVDAATRLARLLVNGSDADDLVSEAFVKVLNVLLGGGGPDLAFRAYLLTAVRRLHVDRIRSNQRLTTTDDLTPYDPGVPFVDPAVTGFEGGAAAKAFASLPERWQMVLWHLEVENQKPADIAPLLGISANSVSALAYRAREGLRQAFLNMHSSDLVDEACRETNGQLGAYVRGGLSRRDSTRVEQHLDHCRGCTAVYLELSEVNSSLAALLGPIVLGTAALGYLGGAGAGVGVGAGVAALVGRGRDLVLSNAPVSAAAALGAVGVAGVVALSVTLMRTPPSPSATEPPSSLSRPAPSSNATPSPGSAGTTSPTPSARTTTGTRTSATTPSTAAAARRTAAPVTVAVAAPRADVGTSSPPPRQPQQPGKKPGSKPGSNPGTTPVVTPPSQGPVGTPAPAPDPTPAPDPAPVEPPDPADPAPPVEPGNPPPATADVGLQIDSGPAPGGRGRVIVRLTGVPGGGRVQLQVTGDSDDYQEHGGGDCTRSGADMLCTATSSRPWFLFRTERPRTTATLSFRVLVPAGFTDPDPSNNTATVTISRQG